ncbi:MAG: LOG family protein [Microthrixaceae bacterium]
MGFLGLDEFFEIITLLQTGKMIDRPLILVGKVFWENLLLWCRKSLIAEGMIRESELNRIIVVDHADEVLVIFSNK